MAAALGLALAAGCGAKSGVATPPRCGTVDESFCVVVTVSRPTGVHDVVVQDGLATTIPRGFDVPIEICGQLVPEA